jgi:hypothetical protein
MANIIDYVKWRGDLSLKVSEFNEIDALILNRFSYFPLDTLIKENEEATIEVLANRFEKANREEIKVLWKDDADLFPAIGKSSRFKHMIATDYTNKIDLETEKQFSAVTIFLPDNTIYISFRGTDNTIVGWKEDFNMSFNSHVESQKSAKNYLEYIAKKYPFKKLRLGGHSKGGNLAIYSAVFANPKIQKRIINIYNNDGPGFNKDIIELPEYKNIISKVVTYIPQDSIIGVALNHEEKFTIVQSLEKGVMEHDVYSWQVVSTDFVVLKEVTNTSKFVDKTITNWLESLDLNTRREVTNIIFDIIGATNMTTTKDFKMTLLKHSKTIVSSYNQLSQENKKMIGETVTALLGIIKENVIEEYKKEK